MRNKVGKYRLDAYSGIFWNISWWFSILFCSGSEDSFVSYGSTSNNGR